MSRVAKQIIKMPEGVTCTPVLGNIFCKGPKGEINVHFPDGFELVIENNSAKIDKKHPKASSAQWGTLVANLKNAIQGVTTPFEKKVSFVGVGYKAIKQGDDIELHLGYSHPIIFAHTPGVEIEIKKPTELVFRSHNKQVLGDACARMAKLRKVEPYKGKGVIVEGQFILRKEGKKK
jgi:large subunit ribosomal protein L6